VADNAQSGKPSTAVTDVNTNKDEQLLKEDRTDYYANTLKTRSRNVIWKKRRIFNKTVVSASRQCMAA
jgi:hypothetical protein